MMVSNETMNPTPINREDPNEIFSESLQLRGALTEANKQIGELRGVKEAMLEQIGSDGVSIDEYLLDKTIDDIKRLTIDECKELLDALDFSVDNIIEDAPKDKHPEILKDFLLYFKQADVSLIEIEEHSKKFQEDLAESEKEIQNILETYDSPISFTRDNIRKGIDKATETNNESLLKSYTAIEKAFNQSLTLTELFEDMKTRKLGNIMSDYYSEDRALRIYTKYMKIVDKLKVRSDLTKLDNFEIMCLDEKYHSLPNLFLFSVIRHYSYKDINKVSKEVDGTFLTQLFINLSSIMLNEKISEEDSNSVKTGVQNILDLFYDSGIK